MPYARFYGKEAESSDFDRESDRGRAKHPRREGRVCRCAPLSRRHRDARHASPPFVRSCLVLYGIRKVPRPCLSPCNAVIFLTYSYYYIDEDSALVKTLSRGTLQKNLDKIFRKCYTKGATQLHTCSGLTLGKNVGFVHHVSNDVSCVATGGQDCVFRCAVLAVHFFNT